MDNLGSNAHPTNKPDDPIPFDLDEPIRLDDKPGNSTPGVSRAPLNLGGGGGAPAPTPKAPAATPRAPVPKPKAPAATPRAPVPKPAAPRPVQPRPVASIAATGRITGCKTFFTKLHAGAIEFLDEQITGWLKDNPDIVIKQTNVSVGDVAAKKTEPNILIVVWY
jgi:hypothetical protein